MWLGVPAPYRRQFLQQQQPSGEQQVAGIKDGKDVEFNDHVQPDAQGKEPLKQGQDKPTAKQKEKQDKAQDKSLKTDTPKKSKRIKL